MDTQHDGDGEEDQRRDVRLGCAAQRLEPWRRAVDSVEARYKTIACGLGQRNHLAHGECARRAAHREAIGGRRWSQRKSRQSVREVE